jgi:hypothetical protein
MFSTLKIVTEPKIRMGAIRSNSPRKPQKQQGLKLNSNNLNPKRRRVRL